MLEALAGDHARQAAALSSSTEQAVLDGDPEPDSRADASAESFAPESAMATPSIQGLAFEGYDSVVPDTLDPLGMRRATATLRDAPAPEPAGIAELLGSTRASPLFGLARIRSTPAPMSAPDAVTSVHAARGPSKVRKRHRGGSKLTRAG